MPTTPPSSTQKIRLVTVTATTNWWCRLSGIGDSWLSGCGAPTMCGATISATPISENSAVPRNAISASPAAVAATVPDPPDLAVEQFGGGHGRQFRRQAEARRKREHGKAGKAPERALTPAVDAAGEFRRGDEHQREADAGDDVGERIEGEALEAVGGRPGFLLMLMRSGFGRRCSRGSAGAASAGAAPWS